MHKNFFYAIIIIWMVSLQDNPNAGALYIQWMCAAPQNNKQLADEPKYSGVGGHLFAIAGKKSVDYGMDR